MLTRPFRESATFSISGASCLQYPHHGAVKDAKVSFCSRECGLRVSTADLSRERTLACEPWKCREDASGCYRLEALTGEPWTACLNERDERDLTLGERNKAPYTGVHNATSSTGSDSDKCMISWNRVESSEGEDFWRYKAERRRADTSSSTTRIFSAKSAL